MSKTILIQGLPGAGKTTLAQIVAKKLGAVHINADWARSTVTKHLGFGHDDRVKQAHALAQMARMIQEHGQWVVVDFVCPIKKTRYAFLDEFKSRSDVFSVWMNTIDKSRFEDTNTMYQPPVEGIYDYRIDGFQDAAGFETYATDIVKLVTQQAQHRSFYIRYNTASDGKHKHWRIIDASDMSETLVDDFQLDGRLTPGSTIEHDVLKWNVLATGHGVFTSDDQGRITFTLKY